ncbi:hypothetical protein B4U78_013745 [Microbacterium esteraromaticum]|nr:hypothetical protein B4U78_013745 [Microbacterium esteraromaticum]
MTTSSEAALKQDADLKRALIASAGRTIAVTTADKFGASATFAVCPAEHIDTLVSKDIPDEPSVERHLWDRAPRGVTLDP